MKDLKKFTEFRVLVLILCGIAIIYLLRLVWGIMAIFSDVALLLILSWLLSFILEPLVKKFAVWGTPRIVAAGLVYLGLVVIIGIASAIIIPTIVTQLTILAGLLPVLFSSAPGWAAQLQTFLTTTLANSVVIISSFASAIMGSLLVLIISFYFSIERAQISKFILDIIPDEYKDDYRFLEGVINNSFANFLRTQVVLGILVGVATLIVLSVLRINYILSASVAAGVLAVIPVVGPALAIIPPLLPAFLVSVNTGLVVLSVLFLTQQIIYNVVSPKVLGKALKIHPLIVLLSFVIGYKIGGAWGAIFAVPVTSAAVVVLREFIKHWKEQT